MKGGDKLRFFKGKNPWTRDSLVSGNGKDRGGGMTTVTMVDWIADGRKLFGDDPFVWEFVCPSCGHIQKMNDFLKHKDKGATPSTAHFDCIGRYDGHTDVDMFTRPGPCNYSSGGLICITPVLITDEETGKTYKSFDFARGSTA